MQPAVVSKGQFAALRKVSASRVSQWIAEGKLDADALAGEGRFAKINVAVATAQLQARLDPAQRLGNGATTDLNLERPPSTERGSATSAITPKDDPYRLARLRELDFKNAELAEKQLARRGLYTATAEVSTQMAALAAALVSTFEGGLPALAAALAARFELPQRDVLHLLRAEFTALRAKAADQAARQAAGLPALIAADPDPAESAPPENAAAA